MHSAQQRKQQSDCQQRSVNITLYDTLDTRDDIKFLEVIKFY